MPRFAANLTMLFTEQPFMERFAAAKQAGFDYVEYLFPYAYPVEQLQEALHVNQLQQVLFNLPPGNWEEGERGIASLPDRQDEFAQGLEQAVHYAKALKVKQLNCLAGLRDTRFSEAEQWQTLVKNVRLAASALATQGIRLLVEPINSRVDMPGFMLDTIDKTEQLLAEVKHPNLAIQFDLYHMQIMHGDLTRLLTSHFEQIQHIQFADNPGRHEPGSGELNFDFLFQTIDQLGYEGYVSAEYRPSDLTRNSLGWLPSKA